MLASFDYTSILLLSEVGGKEASADAKREIGFGFVSCSCRACVRAGEAKLRGRVRQVIFSTLGFRLGSCPPPSPDFCPAILMLYAWALRFFSPGAYYMGGLLGTC